MNQPPHIGSRGGFGLGDARPPGVAMPGKTSDQYDNMVAQEVVINDDTLLDILRTCGDLDDLDKEVFATVGAKRGGRVIFCESGYTTCSKLYDEQSFMRGHKHDGFIGNVECHLSSQDAETFFSYSSSRDIHAALVSCLEDSTVTWEIVCESCRAVRIVLCLPRHLISTLEHA